MGGAVGTGLETEYVPDSLLEKLRASRDLALKFLLDRIDSSGKPEGGPEHHARLPWTLAVAGARPEAAAVLSWHEREVLGADGDLLPGPNRDRWTFQWSSYPLSMLAFGAWILERYDTALAIMDTLVDFQDVETGGAFAQRPEVRKSQRQDLFPTAQLGMSGLMTGRPEVAARCFTWLTDLYQTQPHLPSRLYTARDENGLMIPTKDSPPTRIGSSFEFEVVTDFDKPKQAFYNPGIAAAFLARYYMATGDENAKHLGQNYLSLSEKGTERQFDHSESMQICKFGWGAANMLEIDPTAGHLLNVLKMTKWFIASQRSDGSWRDSAFLIPKPEVGDVMEITAEFALHESTLLKTLLGFSR